MMTFFHTTERKALRAELCAHADLPDLRHWFPVTLKGEQIIWRQVAARFDAPFFGDTLDRQPQAERRVCLTPLPAASPVLARQLQALPSSAPAAFIFHVSRCGSTLLAQLLATLPQCTVMSEPPIIDACLRMDWDAAAHAPGARIALLRQMMLALGQRRHPGETHLIVKLDSWHIPHLPLLRAAFPDTPCFFLYRAPQAVLASHRRERGPQMVPGMVLPADLDASTASARRAPGDLDLYCVQVLTWMLDHALAQADQLEWINYSELPGAVWERLLPRLGLRCDEHLLAAMQARSGFHAKRQVSPFEGDPAGARDDGDASNPARQALDMALMPRYHRLEQLRLAGL